MYKEPNLIPPESKNQYNINLLHEMTEEAEDIRFLLARVKHFHAILNECYLDCVTIINDFQKRI